MPSNWSKTASWRVNTQDVVNALALDKQSDNTILVDTIEKEVKNSPVSFNIIEDGSQLSNGYQYVKWHVIFDTKMVGFCCNSRLVAGEKMTDIPAMVTHSSIMSQESVQLIWMIASLNVLKVMIAFIIIDYCSLHQIRYGPYLIPSLLKTMSRRY